MNEKFGDRLMKMMKDKGLSQKDLASLVGVTESAMSRYLKNEREPKIETIANMATALGTTTDYLIYGYQSAFDFAETYRLVARSSSFLNSDQRMKLITMLLKEDGK